MTVWGNEELIGRMRTMCSRGRLPQGIILWGEQGLGKRTLAQYLAQMIFCRAPHGPCGVCEECRLIGKRVHPELRYAEHSGKKGGFSVETIRTLCSDLMLPPLVHQAKVYIFDDCDNMEERAQNLLLKAIEEPPAYAYFIFTARSPEVFLPTIRSRMQAFPVQPLTEDTCRRALKEKGLADEEAAQALEVFHGNLGMCMAYHTDEEIRTITALTKTAIRCIIDRDEYSWLAAVTALDKNRDGARLYLTLLGRTLRDAALLNRLPHTELLGCDAKGAELLSARLSVQALRQMHMAIDETYRSIGANVNLVLALSALCGACIGAV